MFLRQGSCLLSFRVIVPSKSVKKMIFGFEFRVSGKGIVVDMIGQKPNKAE
jgi:hypothetical protein